LARYYAGEQVDLAALCAANPHCAEELNARLRHRRLPFFQSRHELMRSADTSVCLHRISAPPGSIPRVSPNYPVCSVASVPGPDRRGATPADPSTLRLDLAAKLQLD